MSVSKGANKVLRSVDFAKRLTSACDAHSEVPEPNYGRLKWVVDRLKQRGVRVSTESVRKWFAGEGRPRHDKAQALAEILSIDLSWLLLGTASKMTPKDHKMRSASASGAVNVVAGFIQMAGGVPAFPDPDEETDEDLTAIIRGKRYIVNVTLGEVEGSEVSFHCPVEHEHLTVIGVIPLKGAQAEFLRLSTDLIEKAPSKGGWREFAVNKVGRDYYFDGQRVNRITEFAERL